MIFGSGKFLFINFIFVFANISSAQFLLKANIESGYYRSEGSNLESLNNFVSRFETKLGYNYKKENSSASISLKVKPEYYGFEKNLNTLKLNGALNYFNNGNIFSWGLNSSKQNNFYSGRNIDLNYDILSLAFGMSYQLNNKNLLLSNIGYAYQNVSKNFNQNLDLIFADLKNTQPVFENIKLGYGIYAERFYLKNKLKNISANNFEEKKNSGWRFGPQININFLKSFVINFNYRFLFHTSKFTMQPSNEQWIRFVGGKIISKNWSAFILVDYYVRKFTLKNDNSENLFLLYNPINLENRVFIKAAYDISGNIETYFKTGYSKENLSGAFSFSGWNILAGIEITN